MTRPIVRIYADGTFTDHEMNDSELAAYELQIKEDKKYDDAQTAQAAAKTSAYKKLAALGLTADEIAAL